MCNVWQASLGRDLRGGGALMLITLLRVSQPSRFLITHPEHSLNFLSASAELLLVFRVQLCKLGSLLTEFIQKNLSELGFHSFY